MKNNLVKISPRECCVFFLSHKMLAPNAAVLLHPWHVLIPFSGCFSRSMCWLWASVPGKHISPWKRGTLTMAISLTLTGGRGGKKCLVDSPSGLHFELHFGLERRADKMWLCLWISKLGKLVFGWRLWMISHRGLEAHPCPSILAHAQKSAMKVHKKRKTRRQCALGREKQGSLPCTLQISRG